MISYRLFLTKYFPVPSQEDHRGLLVGRRPYLTNWKAAFSKILKNVNNYVGLEAS
jgi:hypothetical protein